MNRDCRNKCPVTVHFGTQPVSGDSCDIQANAKSKKPLSPGDNATLSVDAGTVTRASDERYCYKVSICRENGEYFLCYIHTYILIFLSVTGRNGGSGLSTGPLTGIVLCGIVAVIVAVIFVLVCYYKCSKTKRNTSK